MSKYTYILDGMFTAQSGTPEDVDIEIINNTHAVDAYYALLLFCKMMIILQPRKRCQVMSYH